MITTHAMTPADYDSWLPLWQGYLRFYETELPEDVTRLTFARLTGDEEQMWGLLARNVEGQAIGFTHWLMHRATWTASYYGYLEDLYVDPSVRGTGAGRALIEAVYAAAQDKNCAQVYWLTHETNLTAQQLYNRIATRSGLIHYKHVL
jgi:GNAT superfamily N-acetyltransferase